MKHALESGEDSELIVSKEVRGYREKMVVEERKRREEEEENDRHFPSSFFLIGLFVFSSLICSLLFF